MMNNTTSNFSAADNNNNHDKIARKLKRQTIATRVAGVSSLAVIATFCFAGGNEEVFNGLICVALVVSIGCYIACRGKGLSHLLSRTAKACLHMPIFPANLIATYFGVMLLLIAALLFPFIGTYASLRETKAELAG